MASKKAIVDFLDDFLHTADFIDKSANGLQVDGADDVKKVGFCVDASLECFWKAKELGCNMVIVHHGLFWDKIGPLVDDSYKRYQALISNGISLYASHAPLDAHPTNGNNAQIMEMFSLKPKHKFGFSDEVWWGYQDILAKPQNIDFFKKKLKPEHKVYLFNERPLQKIACVSGGGNFIEEAAKSKIDLFITGEFKHSHYHIAKEGNVNVIAMGHYDSETFGLRSLMPLIEKRFKAECIFIDIPTGL